MAFLTGFSELMLMHVITDSIKEKYETINKLLCTNNIQASLNKTRPVDNPYIFILKDIETDDKHDKAKVMEELMAEHFQLTAVAKKANKLFGLPMLVTLSALFHTTTTCVYFTIICFSMSTNFTLTQTISTTWWCALLIFHTWMIVHVWDSLANEVRILLFLPFRFFVFLIFCAK